MKCKFCEEEAIIEDLVCEDHYTACDNCDFPVLDDGRICSQCEED